jgi:thiol-disulfide isomerase/thioredoxin
MHHLLVISVGLFIQGCGPATVHEIPLRQLDGGETTLGSIQAAPYSVVFFLSPECPLCENYSHVISDLRAQYPRDSMAFVGVFPGTYYDKLTIQGFLARYHPAVEVLLDPAYRLTEALGATVTPEVFVLDQAGRVRYQGPIDNWIPKLGVKRRVITAHYLESALDALLRGDPLPIADQPAVGCFIE